MKYTIKLFFVFLLLCWFHISWCMFVCKYFYRLSNLIRYFRSLKLHLLNVDEHCFVMDSEKDFEVLFKDRNPGNLTIIIKRKTPSRFDLSSSSLSSHDGSSPEYEYNCNDVLSTTKRSDDSLLSFYSRPDESYETLIQMAFEDVCDEQRDQGLQAHDIAQWLCRKWEICFLIFGIMNFWSCMKKTNIIWLHPFKIKIKVL